MKSPILGSAYVARSANAADNRMVNLFPEIVPEGGKEAAFLNRAPGLRLYQSVGDGPIRGMHVLGDELYVVSGTELHRVNADPITVASDGSLVEGPDNCGIASATNITGDGTITLTTSADGYQFTVGDETWPASPAPWIDIYAGSPHAFTLAVLAFDETAPVELPAPPPPVTPTTIDIQGVPGTTGAYGIGSGGSNVASASVVAKDSGGATLTTYNGTVTLSATATNGVSIQFYVEGQLSPQTISFVNGVASFGYRINASGVPSTVTITATLVADNTITDTASTALF